RSEKVIEQTKLVGFDNHIADSSNDTQTSGKTAATSSSGTGIISSGSNSETGTLRLDQQPIATEDLNSLVFFLASNFKAFSALCFIYNPFKEVFVLNSLYSKSMHIIPGVRIAKAQGIIGSIAVEKASFLSGNITNYNQAIDYYSKDEMINSILAVPILSYTNELLGALVVDSKDKLAFRDNQKDMMLRFSRISAALIINVKMRKYQEDVAKQLQIFNTAAQQFTVVQHPQQVFDILFKTIGEWGIFFTRLMAIDFHPESNSCSIRKTIGNHPFANQGFTFPLNNGLISQVIKTKQSIVIDNIQRYQQRFYFFVPEEGRDSALVSCILIPFATAESICRGVIYLESTIVNQFNGENGQQLATLISNASVAFQKAYLYQQMELLATTDGLTSLLNHRTFQDKLTEEISRCQRYNHMFSLIIMDIDHFKKFNDTYGHTVGDLVIKEIAACIRKSIRRIDIPARYGGEEFAVILPEIGADTALPIAERIRATIEAQTIMTKNETLHVTVSIGCATFPLVATEKQRLIVCADAAMYLSKEGGRNRVTVYDKRLEMDRSKDSVTSRFALNKRHTS
ncbi:MAG: diguanylate cyclase, partial [Chitinivibrionales bacterium]|nr:diguanylate cyclase [Chitinivibrionales bacterium]